MVRDFKGSMYGIRTYHLKGYDADNDVYLDGIYDIHEDGKIEGPYGIVRNDNEINSVRNIVNKL